MCRKKSLCQKKILGAKKFLGPKQNVGPKIILGQKNFVSKRNFGSKKIFGKKTIGKHHLCATNGFLVYSVIINFGWVLLVVLVTGVIKTPNPLNS